jgi:hypothetical protein
MPGSFMLVTFPHRVEEKLHGTIISLPTLNPERGPIALGRLRSYEQTRSYAGPKCVMKVWFNSCDAHFSQS